MLLITCPHCGPRDEIEYSCGGEAHITRPLVDSDDQEWAGYLFYRSNSKGVTLERWCHTYGCGRWFNVARDSVSHQISAVYAMGDPKPALSSAIESVEPILTEASR